MPDNEQWKPSREELIETNLGKETLEAAADVSRSMFDAIKTTLADISVSEGSSETQREKAKQYLALWQEFANNLFARTSSTNATSPELVETTLRGANSLLSVEPSREGKEAAEKLQAALEQRYQ